MKKQIMGLFMVALALFAALPVQAERVITSQFADTADGTRSATAFVPKGNGFGNVLDLSYRVDANLTSGTIDIRFAESESSITSATTGTGSVLWFDNDPTVVSLAEYVIFYDDSAKTYFLYRCTATASTSITVQETAPITTTSDKLYPCGTTIRRAAPEVRSSTLGTVNIWTPSNLPAAFTIDGNTTSCRISIIGNRIRD